MQVLIKKFRHEGMENPALLEPSSERSKVFRININRAGSLPCHPEKGGIYNLFAKKSYGKRKRIINFEICF